MGVVEDADSMKIDSRCSCGVVYVGFEQVYALILSQHS